MALEIKIGWEASSIAAPEENAAFGALSICYGRQAMTEVIDSFSDTSKNSAHLSAYHLAEWLAWNWYRLRWEPRKISDDWSMAHRMATIGAGYVWPNISIYSDGPRIAMISKPTDESKLQSVRYISDVLVVMPAASFESAVDSFIEHVLARLNAKGLPSSNLRAVWTSVMEDRSDSARNQFRKFEALMGREPDCLSEKMLQDFSAAAEELGLGAIEEVAATGKFRTVGDLRNDAQRGFDYSPTDFVSLNEIDRPQISVNEKAWAQGATFAKLLRKQENIADGPMSDKNLAELAAVSQDILGGAAKKEEISFGLKNTNNHGKLLLTKRHPTGRRFELARLIGDGLVWAQNERLMVATDQYTYRQQFQRAFAAELLCPFESLSQELAGDFSEDAIQEAAELFKVSPFMIEHHLANHGVGGKKTSTDDYESAA